MPTKTKHECSRAITDSFRRTMTPSYVGGKLRKTLRKLYAPAWNRWTLAEPVDKKKGAVSEKA